jgi:hypothetical protein
MNFIQWTNNQESNNPIAANPKTIKTREERDRLTRMEATLNELLLRQVTVEAKAFQRPEKKHAKP